MIVNPPVPEAGAARLAAGPALAGIPVAVLGPTRSELLVGRLLRDHGADVRFVPEGEAGPGLVPDTAPGIVVDAERETGSGALPASAAAELVAAGGIYCLFTGLPPTAPAAVPPSHETLIAAELGLNRVANPAGKPDPEPLGVASGYAAIWAAIYLTAALRVRLTAGRGSRIEVPLFSAGLSVIGRNLVSLERPELIDPLTRPKLPISEIYECRDGRFVQSHGTFPHFADILCRVIGQPEWAADAAAGVTELASPAEVQLWRDRFAAAFRQRDALDWERTLNEAGGACTMCRTHEEWRREHEVAETGIVSIAPDLLASGPGQPGLTGPAVTISAEACLNSGARTGGVAGRPAGAGSSWPERPATGESAHPLSDLRVLDFCIILAGPTCGRTLAELGADVIKIDSPGRPVSPYGWLDVNRGKRSMLIDLKNPSGVALARELAASADIVLENFRAGKMTQLALGYAALQELRPGLVYGSMNAFDYGSDWAARAGWEHNAQAGSGMQVARQRDGRPQAVPVPVNDYATGLLAALGVLLAVLRRDRTGAPAQVRASLARTATFLQLGAAAGEEQLSRPPEASFSLRTTDGWIRAEPAGPADGRDPAADFANPAEFAGYGCAEALGMIRDRGVLAVTERTPQDLLDEAWARDEGLIVTWEHPRWGPLRQGVARMRASEFRPSAGWPAPDPGEHTADILAQLGRGQAEIDRLYAQGAVAGPRPLFPVPE
jgi:crotonobetainyl-CoA:carnitine CoA-transferase CaiB-like acyl-CoA transferase